MQKPSYLFLDEEEQCYVNVYETKEGKICPYYIWKNPFIRQVAAYTSMKLDLINCIGNIQYLIQINPDPHIPQPIKMAILSASLVLYAKCFTEGKGRGTSLNKELIFQSKLRPLLDFHLQTMELRNSYLAHAGKEEPETRNMILVLNPDRSNKKIEDIKYAGMKLKDDDSNLEQYLYLFDAVLSFVLEKLVTINKLLIKKMTTLDLEEIYQQSKLPNKEKFVEFNITTLDT